MGVAFSSLNSCADGVLFVMRRHAVFSSLCRVEESML